jgi:carotenoid cleavage dioxygenase
MTAPYPDHPQLRGNFAPLRMECDLEDVIVRGELPRELSVTYYRNGPDPQYPPRGSHHWFAGDGMIHMFRIEDGRVRYRNRWARTVKWRMERAAGRALFSAFDPAASDPSVAGVAEDGLANTNVVWHGNRLLALEEGHAPFELDPLTLDSLGPWRFDDALEGPMTAHPKLDPVTGEMLFFGYMVDGPFSAGMSYHVADAAGRLTRAERFQAPYGSLERAQSGKPPFAWEPDRPSCIGVMPRRGSVADIRWFETDPCYVFHPMNAYTDGDRIVAHVMQFEEAPLFPHADGSRPDPNKANARLCEWQIDLGDNARGVARRYLDDITGEFPRLDERRTGLRYRHGYYGASTRSDGGLGFDAVVHHDFAADRRQQYVLPAGDATGEPVFVPRAPDAPEGRGYLLCVIYRGAENRSDLAVFDAEHVADGPLALAELPHRVPFGFHGNWKYNH